MAIVLIFPIGTTGFQICSVRSQSGRWLSARVVSVRL